MPGFLIPSDLERMIPAGEDAYLWADKHLLASPGALAIRDGQTFRIHTLVPAVKKDGSCIHLTGQLRCGIHAVAPFGCAYFDCGPERGNLSSQGLVEVMKAWRAGDLYAKLWNRLWSRWKRQHKPDILRERMRRSASQAAVELP
jgi:hypothetical protein